MGNSKKINMTSLYISCIHVPVMKKSMNKSPLYARTAYEGKSGDDLMITRDADWMEISKSTYNSPTNVRRILIYGDTVALNFWKPYIVSGKPSSEGLWRTREIEGVKPSEAAKEMVLYLQAMQSSGDMAYGKNAKFPEYELTGFPLKAIVAPWVLSNLEEIYIDPGILMSHDSGMGLDNIMRRGMTGQFSKRSGFDVQELLLRLSGIPSMEELSKRLSRLKIFAVIPAMIKSVPKETLANQASMLNNKDTLLDLWISKGLVDKNRCGILATEKYGKLNRDKLSVRIQYKFDNEVLSGYADKLEAETLAELAKAVQITKVASGNQEKAEMGEVEQYLEQLRTQKDINHACNVLRLAIARYTMTEKKQEYEKLTQAGKDTYGAVLGYR